MTVFFIFELRVLKTIAELKQAGKIRAFGISLKDKEPNAANELIQWRQVDVLQVFFNLLYQEPISKLFPILKKYKIGMDFEDAAKN